MATTRVLRKERDAGQGRAWRTSSRPRPRSPTSTASSGLLFYVGYDIHELAEQATFEETVYLLHNLELPNKSQLDEVTEQLTNERGLDTFVEGLMPTMVQQTSPMSMLRTTVSAMSAHDPDGWDQSTEANYRKAMRLIARFTDGHRDFQPAA